MGKLHVSHGLGFGDSTHRVIKGSKQGGEAPASGNKICNFTTDKNEIHRTRILWV